MNNIDILEEKEKEAIKDLEEYLHWEELQGFSMLPRDKHIETLLNLVSTLIVENKELKEKKEKIINKLKEDVELASTTAKWLDKRTKQVVPTKTIIVNESDYAKTILKILEE